MKHYKITFRRLKENCMHLIAIWCDYCPEPFVVPSIKCTERNCPVLKKCKEAGK